MKTLSLMEIVEQAFNNANENPDVARWHSCAIVAGCAAVRMAADGDLFKAAALEGVCEEAHRQRKALETVAKPLRAFVDFMEWEAA